MHTPSHSDIGWSVGNMVFKVGEAQKQRMCTWSIFGYHQNHMKMTKKHMESRCITCYQCCQQFAICHIYGGINKDAIFPSPYTTSCYGACSNTEAQVVLFIARWGVPSCTCVNIYQLVESVNHCQFTCERGSLPSALWIYIAHEMMEQLGQLYCIKSCQKLGKTEGKTIWKILQTFGNDGMGTTLLPTGSKMTALESK